MKLKTDGHQLLAHHFKQLLSIFDFFWIALLAGGRGGAAGRQQWLAPLGASSLWFSIVIIVQMLLSGDLARMGYLAAPVFAVALALLISRESWLETPRAAVNEVATQGN